jgi:hypothetical protein
LALPRSSPMASQRQSARAPGFPPRPLSSHSPLSERWAVGGSRFWALVDESSDEEEEREAEVKVSDEASGGVSSPSSVTVGDFLSPAWQKVSLRKSGAGGRRRNRFAPGGHRSSFGQVSAVPPLPDLRQFLGASQWHRHRNPPLLPPICKVLRRRGPVA